MIWNIPSALFCHKITPFSGFISPHTLGKYKTSDNTTDPPPTGWDDHRIGCGTPPGEASGARRAPLPAAFWQTVPDP